MTQVITKAQVSSQSGAITQHAKYYLKAVANIASTASYGHPSHINDWHKKKQQSSVSKGTKKIAIGAMSRLLRIMHYLVINNQSYNYNIASKH